MRCEKLNPNQNTKTFWPDKNVVIDLQMQMSFIFFFFGMSTCVFCGQVRPRPQVTQPNKGRGEGVSLTVKLF